MNDRDRMELGRGALRQKFICPIATALLGSGPDLSAGWIAVKALQYTDALIDVLIESELELEASAKPS